MTMQMRAVQKHECPRCGIETESETLCYGCERDLAPYLEKISAKVPFCGLCGDTGRMPAEAELRWGTRVRFDEIDESLICPDCPCCPSCGVEYRLHGDLTVCP